MPIVKMSNNKLGVSYGFFPDVYKKSRMVTPPPPTTRWVAGSMRGAPYIYVGSYRPPLPDFILMSGRVIESVGIFVDVPQTFSLFACCRKTHSYRRVHQDIKSKQLKVRTTRIACLRPQMRWKLFYYCSDGNCGCFCHQHQFCLVYRICRSAELRCEQVLRGGLCSSTSYVYVYLGGEKEPFHAQLLSEVLILRCCARSACYSICSSSVALDPCKILFDVLSSTRKKQDRDFCPDSDMLNISRRVECRLRMSRCT